MSHAQLTGQQAAASQLLTRQIFIWHGAVLPVTQSPKWWMTAANSDHHVQSHLPPVVPKLMKQEL